MQHQEIIFYFISRRVRKYEILNARLLIGFFCWQRITEKQNSVVITDRMWARLLSSTNQPSFLSPKDAIEDKKEESLPGSGDTRDGTDDCVGNGEISY